ncbi:homocysteine-responsive endoplasmic reticulum-resident ubiquitin-like domain member 2 protein [Eucyclogobius newberryi]|uniref:homocysteine-responsive endoplasmic reticulum-resident ubiquitin-like domain member 2 protein n=1 Tax=Eucyclogobius newberryi TaxID=166745 RepID=UPI003B5B0134
MDPGALDAPVTLVIKAPNQKYEDQTINCFRNWTVERLKSHISNVYPSKPLSKDQRLVYSGQLLQDHVQLRDVLRKHDEYHMMHLVCASRSPPSSPQAHSAAPSASSESSSSSSPNQEASPSSEAADGLRYRGGLPQYNVPGVPQWPGGAQVPLQGALPGSMPPHPAYMPMQVLWWQQMYARHYYMQYQAAIAASQTPSPSAPSGPSPSPPQPEPAVQPPLGPNPLPEPPPAVNPNIQVNANIQMNAQGGAVLNEDELNRDWLDWLYTVSRAGVLLSIVYFYSSFSRFVMVLGAMLLVYLHQAGWFPFRAEQQQARAERGAAQAEADRQQDMQDMERLMDEGLEEGNPEEGDPEEGPSERDGATAATPAPEPGFLTTAWAFISTFFTSLIPEGRPQPAN